MKNLIDELHKLDEYEYEVSKDFSKNVMNNIRMSKKSNKANSVISLVSIGLVACLAVFTFHNSGIKNNFNMNNSKGTESITYTNNNGYYDTDFQVSSANEIEKIDRNEFKSNDLVAEDSVKNDNINIENNIQNTSEVLIVKEYSGEKYNKIRKILNNAELEYEMFEAEIKVKASLSDVSKLLENYTNVVMEVQDEYVIIHVRE